MNRVLAILVGIALARSLGPGGKGAIAYAAIALELFVVAVGGLTQAVTYQYTRNGASGGTVYAAMLRIVAVSSTAAAIGVGALALTVSSQHALFWVAIAIPFAMYGEATIGLLLGAQQIGATNVQRFLTSGAFNLSAILAVILFKANVSTVLTLWVLGYVVAALFAAYAVRLFVREGRNDRAVIRNQIRFASKASLASLLGYITMRVDVVIVSIVLGASALGVYTLAIGLAELLWQLSQPMCWAAFGRIASMPAAEAGRFTAKIVRHILALLCPFALLAFVFGPALVKLVYGPVFAGAGTALRWLLPGIVAYAIEIPLGYYLMVKLGRPMVIVAIQSASILTCVAVTLLTARTWGINGAALATSATYIAVVAAKAFIFLRATGMRPRDLFVIKREDFRVGSVLQKYATLKARLLPKVI